MIVIGASEEDGKPASPLGAGVGYMLAPGFIFYFLPSSSSSSHIQHAYTTKTIITHTVTLTALLSLHKYHLTWSAKEVHESKIDYTNTIRVHSVESTAVEQGVACVPVMQQAWVQSPVGTSFLVEVLSHL